MPHRAIRLAACAGLHAFVLTIVAASCLADPGVSPIDAKRLLRADPLSVSSPEVTRVAVHAPGQHDSEVLAVFKMRFDSLLPGLFGIDPKTLRPYLLGGQTAIRLPSGRTVGQDLKGSGEAHALHIGAGADVRLRDRFFLSLAFGEILHSGPLSQLSYRTYKLGFLYDF